MEEKKSSADGNIKFKLDEDYSNEVEYSPFENRNKKKKWERLSFGGFQKTEMALIILGGFLVILIILFVVFLPGKSKTQDALRLTQLESRLQAVEEKLGRLELVDQQLAIVAEQSKEFGMFMERYDRLDAAMALKLDLLAQQVNDLQKRMEIVKARSAETIKPKAEKPAASPAEKKPATKTTTERYHTVRPGDTIYSISRRYGVTVGDLQHLNKLSSDLLIYPGQKLRIPAVKTN